MNKNVKGFIIISIGLLSLFACSSNSIIPQKDMVKILKKIYLTDGTINVSNVHSINSKDSVEYYEPILELYGYTTAQFDSSIKHYSRHTEEFDEILDRVIIELSKMEELNLTEEKRLDSLHNMTCDTSFNLWPHKTYWDMALDHSQNPSLGFDVPVKGFGTYTVAYDAQIFADDESEDTRSYIFFFYDDKSTVGMRLNDVFENYPKDSVTRRYCYSLELTDSLVTHLSGWLYDHGGERKDLKRHAIFSHLSVTYKPKQRDSLAAPVKAKPILIKPASKRRRNLQQ